MNKTAQFCFVFEGIHEFYVVKNEFNNVFTINFGFVKMATRPKFDVVTSRNNPKRCPVQPRLEVGEYPRHLLKVNLKANYHFSKCNFETQTKC